jgi:outer membrane protein TolC
MKNKFILLIVISGLTGATAFPQSVITLKECYEKALNANALAGEKDAYSKISGLKDQNLARGWLPTLDANASASYISDVVSFNGLSAINPALSAILPSMPHDQYKVTLDINQVIYDGGAIKSGRALEKAELVVNQKQTETDLYKTRSLVNTYYFNILLLTRQKELLINYQTLISKRIAAMQSAAENGVTLKSDIDILISEKLKLGQQITENDLKKESLVKNLSALTGIKIDAGTEFTLPVPPAELKNELTRPELQLYDMRKQQLAAGLQLSQSKRMPRVFGYATLGYGNPPGNDFFNNKFDTYYMVGGGIKWNIFDWNKVRNEKRVISIQEGILDNRKRDLEDNLTRQLETKSAEIASLKTLVATDEELIALRKRITATAESQYQNTVITATEYMNELNSQQQAEINYEIHKINLALAGTEYLNISGRNIE